MFQSTHPRGVRPGSRPESEQHDGVSIHAPAWGATSLCPASGWSRKFQSTHPRGVRQECVIPYISPIDGFNPRTRVGCDSMASYRPSMIFLFQSTHPRGVRPMRQATSDKEDAMFQSTHPRGVRRTRRRRQSRLSQCFNPRTRVGCDTAPNGRNSMTVRVSIHAPAWGATPRPLTGFLRHKSFNPRTLVGCDWRPCWAFPSASRFQSTHPRGVRHAVTSASGLVSAFQSTHPRGVRHQCGASSPSMSMFQSTHPRGVRPGKRSRQRRMKPCFNPRTRVGCDFTPMSVWKRHTGFNPRTRVGCDLRGGIHFRSALWFQSTHPRGVRPHAGAGRYLLRLVSIHAPAWGATEQGAVVVEHALHPFQSTHPRGVRPTREDIICPVTMVSIHAPAWGATLTTLAFDPLAVKFQSTHPRGVRLFPCFIQ